MKEANVRKVRATIEAESELEQMRRRLGQMEQMVKMPYRPPHVRYPVSNWPPQPPSYPNEPYRGTNEFDNRPRPQTENVRRCYERQAPNHLARSCPTRRVKPVGSPGGNPAAQQIVEGQAYMIVPCIPV